MALFDDILKQPLPSQNNGTITESEEDDDFDLNDVFTEEELSELGFESDGTEEDPLEDTKSEEDMEEGCDPNCEPKEEDGEDDFSIADELNSIMKDDPDYDDTDTDDLGDVGDELDGMDDEIEDDSSLPPEPLDGQEDKKADSLLALAATPMILRDELTAEESVQFYESSEADIAVSEGLMLESDISELFEEGVFANPNKPFKMTKKARFNQLYELSVQIEARLHNDPAYAKLQKAYAIERKIKKYLRQRYHGLALRRAKVYLKRLIQSKSGVLSKVGKKIGLKK